MPEQRPNDRPANEPAPISSTGSGLRLRLWVAALAGALAAGGGIWWVIGTQTRPAPATDLPVLVTWLAAVAGGGIVVGAGAALWFDRGLIAHLRGLNEGIHAGQVARLRGLPGSAGWGELSELTLRVQHLISQHRQMARAADELGLTRSQLAQVRESLERWNDTEEWRELWAEGGPLAPITESLNHGLRRLDEVREQNLEVTRQIATELGRVLDDARESSEQAERGFVEATSLLTTVRELQRLEAELARTLAAARGGGPGEETAGFLDAARDAIGELVTASTESVERLSGSLARVTEISDQVRLLGNRSTLIALHAAIAGAEGAAGTDTAAEMRRLATEVQDATSRSTDLCRTVERDAAAALTRMRDVRARVAERLEAVPAPAGGEGEAARDEAFRLLERVREMIQDAARKSERLSAAGERVSRAAERVVRGLEDESGELGGLAARLERPAPQDPEPARPAPSPAAGENPRSGLRLLGQEHMMSSEDPEGGAQVREERP